MWVFFEVPSTFMWNTIKEDDFFVIQEYKAARTPLQGVITSLRSTLGGEKNPYCYRLILKARGSDRGMHRITPLKPQVIAITSSLAEMRDHWQWLQRHIVPACILFDDRAESEERELRQFLVGKLTSLALREKERQKREKEYQLYHKNGVVPKHDNSIPRDKKFKRIAKARKAISASKEAPWKKHFPELARVEDLTLGTTDLSHQPPQTHYLSLSLSLS